MLLSNNWIFCQIQGVTKSCHNLTPPYPYLIRRVSITIDYRLDRQIGNIDLFLTDSQPQLSLFMFYLFYLIFKISVKLSPIGKIVIPERTSSVYIGQSKKQICLNLCPNVFGCSFDVLLISDNYSYLPATIRISG